MDNVIENLDKADYVSEIDRLIKLWRERNTV